MLRWVLSLPRDRQGGTADGHHDDPGSRPRQGEGLFDGPFKVFGGFDKKGADHLVVEVRDHEDRRFFQGQGDGSRLVAAKFEVALHALDKVFRLFGLFDPVGECFGTQPFTAGSHPDDHAALSDGPKGIVQGFLGLVDVDVLREPPGGDDHYIGLFLDGDLAQGVEFFAARPVGSDVVARHGMDDLLVLVEDHVEGEVDLDEAADLLQVLPDGVALVVARPGTLLQHHPVVGPDGLDRRDAGKDGLGPAAVAGKVMKLDVPDADPAVGLHDGPENIDRRAPGGLTQVHTVQGVVVDATVALVDPVAYEGPHLLLGVGTVAPEGEDNGDVRVADAGFPEFLKDGGEHHP